VNERQITMTQKGLQCRINVTRSPKKTNHNNIPHYVCPTVNTMQQKHISLLFKPEIPETAIGRAIWLTVDKATYQVRHNRKRV
jgi:hypothetical protein